MVSSSPAQLGKPRTQRWGCSCLVLGNVCVPQAPNHAPWTWGLEFSSSLRESLLPNPLPSVRGDPRHQRQVCMCHGHLTHRVRLGAPVARATSLVGTAAYSFLFGPFWQPLPFWSSLVCRAGWFTLPPFSSAGGIQLHVRPPELCPVWPLSRSPWLLGGGMAGALRVISALEKCCHQDSE